MLTPFFTLSPATLRQAVADDIPALRDLVRTSFDRLAAGHYTPSQRHEALECVIHIEDQLVLDGTLYVIEREGHLLACGGWSARLPTMGYDELGLPPPGAETAFLRSVFVHPAGARQGLGSRLVAHAETAARRTGHTRMELAATLTGRPLYLRCGYRELRRLHVPLPDGGHLEGVLMDKRLTTPVRTMALEA